ncbi:hypothetical protein [Lacipirellula sp.]|uniref:hypothetical protein n=1 Tax=Lacipirellula sp. TaxID=2691419 RepID=UPI003D142F30
MSKNSDPLAGLYRELCDAWEAWPNREKPGSWPTMKMNDFYGSLRRDYPDLASRMPPERGDEIWQRVKYLLSDHEEAMGRSL